MLTILFVLSKKLLHYSKLIIILRSCNYRNIGQVLVIPTISVIIRPYHLYVSLIKKNDFGEKRLQHGKRCTGKNMKYPLLQFELYSPLPHDQWQMLYWKKKQPPLSIRSLYHSTFIQKKNCFLHF